MAKLERANEQLRASLTTARTNARENQDDLIRKGSGLAGAFVLGSLKRSGKITSIPTIPGVPRTIMLAVVANGIGMAMNRRSKFKMVFDGLGEQALGIAAYEWGQGGEVAGAAERAADADAVEGRRRRVAQARQIENRIRASLEREMARQPAPAPITSRGEPAYEDASLDDYIIDV